MQGPCPCPGCSLFPPEDSPAHPGDVTYQAGRAAESWCCKLCPQGKVCWLRSCLLPVKIRLGRVRRVNGASVPGSRPCGPFPCGRGARAWCSVRSGPRAGGGTGAPLTLCRPARVLGVSQWACGPALRLPSTLGPGLRCRLKVQPRQTQLAWSCHFNLAGVTSASASPVARGRWGRWGPRQRGDGRGGGAPGAPRGCGPGSGPGRPSAAWREACV